jgi:hypothetical protein
MKKLLTATGTAMLLANMTIAPAFADSLAQPTTPGKQQQVVLPEGQMMSDAELAQVEGEFVKVNIATALVVGGISGGVTAATCDWRANAQQCTGQTMLNTGLGMLNGFTFGRAGSSGFGRGAYGR